MMIESELQHQRPAQSYDRDEAVSARRSIFGR